MGKFLQYGHMSLIRHLFFPSMPFALCVYVPATDRLSLSLPSLLPEQTLPPPRMPVQGMYTIAARVCFSDGPASSHLHITASDDVFTALLKRGAGVGFLRYCFRFYLQLLTPIPTTCSLYFCVFC